MADFDDDDDDDLYKGLYENGYWAWNELEDCLIFLSDVPSSIGSETTRHIPVAISPIEFRDDLDVLEQQRFRKRFQRKPMAEDVVTLQDVKDLVLFTAPKSIITSSLVNVLHLPMTERFIRALITYCQYFLQVSDDMSGRIFELHSKIRTDRSNAIELSYRNNLEDLRLLVAKEYCSIIVGAGDLAKYHHMGALKKSRTATKKERILFESILRISTQIVWLTLGRKLYNQIEEQVGVIKDEGSKVILLHHPSSEYSFLFFEDEPISLLLRQDIPVSELEIQRLFKSDIYNIAQHKLSSNYCDDLDQRELFVLFGHCVKQPRKMTAQSPVMHEVNCNRDIDYRMMGLGVIHYESLSPRLRYFERVLITPEEMLKTCNVSIGILGMLRTRFDTMLKEIKIPVTSTSVSTSTATTHRSSQSKNTTRQSKSSTSSAKTSPATHMSLYQDIIIPDKESSEECLPDHFPGSSLQRKTCNEVQRKKWLLHASHLHKINLLHKRKARLKY